LDRTLCKDQVEVSRTGSHFGPSIILAARKAHPHKVIQVFRSSDPCEQVQNRATSQKAIAVP